MYDVSGPQVEQNEDPMMLQFGTTERIFPLEGCVSIIQVFTSLSSLYKLKY